MAVSLFGIRHHGPGSARSLIKGLEELKPDCILIEGPPEADEIIKCIDEKMKPPVAILVYMPEQPKKAVVYPFAVFSPEWQAMQFSLKNNVPVSFMDLPQYYQLGQEEKEEIEENENKEKRIEDPIGLLAKISGYSDGEMWWDNFVENRKNHTEIFQAINEMMTSLRSETETNPEKKELLREAYMRKTIRKAEKDGYKNIAVICGAWHVPALQQKVSVSDDDKLLKPLKKSKTQATWIPWTHNRLSYYTGYGAGIESPGWYHHLWTTENQISVMWMTKVARMLREKDLEVSSAHIIETVRLAETLSIIRDKNMVGLSELNEATQSIIFSGSNLPMKLIYENLIVGFALGEIPENIPITPIQKEFNDLIKKLRLKIELNKNEIDLDLRKENDLEKSYLFHRLNILELNWATIKRNSGKKGTFHEMWTLEWKPEFSVQMIESGIWGNTIYDAANAYAINIANNSSSISEITSLLEVTLVANIPEALEQSVKKLQEKSAVSSDVEDLMMAVPPLANLLRYGNVRKTDSEMVKTVLDSLITRVCIGLINACISINYEGSVIIMEKIIKFNDALKLLQDKEYLDMWYKTLTQLSESENINGVLKGYSVRLLFDTNIITIQETEIKASLALSVTGSISNASEWLEGFLKGSGLLLIHNEKLLYMIDNWLKNLSEEAFTTTLPILRRNFSEFANAEKRQMGEILKHTSKANITVGKDYQIVPNFSYSRAESVLPVLKMLFGVK